MNTPVTGNFNIVDESVAARIQGPMLLLFLFLLPLVVLPGCAAGKARQITQSDSGASRRLDEALEAFRKGEYEKSRLIFQTIAGKPTDASELEEAQWFLARISEAQGNPAEAQQRYTAFIQDFPVSRHSVQAKERLAALSKSQDAGRSSPVPARRRSDGGFTLLSGLSGSLTTEYAHDVLTSQPSTDTQRTLLEALDMRWRNRGGRDVRVYVSGLYSHDFLFEENKRFRLSKLFGEWIGPAAAFDARFGRQPASGNTLFTRYDGFSTAAQLTDHFRLNAGAGFPVQLTSADRVEVQSEHWFHETYLSVYDFYGVGGKVFYTQEMERGFGRRNAVGLNGYWIGGPWSLTAGADYDLSFKKFNDLSAGAEYGHGIYRHSAGVEYRKSPYLDYATALFDPSLVNATPPTTSLGDLMQTQSRDEIRELASANTADSLSFLAGTAVEFSRIWRGDFHYAHAISEVPDLTEGRRDMTSDRLSALITERNGLKLAEVWTLLTSQELATDSLRTALSSTLSKYWSGGALASLRFRWERVEFKTSDTRMTRMVPGAQLSISLEGGTEAALEGDYSIEKSDTFQETVTTVQTIVSLTVPF